MNIHIMLDNRAWLACLMINHMYFDLLKAVIIVMSRFFH